MPAATGRLQNEPITRSSHVVTFWPVLPGPCSLPAIIGHAAAATRGVSDTEIIIGTMTDLSGVTAVQGVNNANAISMAFDEANAKGGIHGRKIRLSSRTWNTSCRKRCRR